MRGLILIYTPNVNTAELIALGCVPMPGKTDGHTVISVHKKPNPRFQEDVVKEEIYC